MKTSEPTVIKKYANRRLYNTGTSTYVTLDDLAQMVKREEDFVVYDAKSGEDITRSVLTQIIVEQEGKGRNLLPATFLRQLIRFYGDSLQVLVPSYLEHSIGALAREQEKLRQQMTETFGGAAFGAMEETARRNMALFEKAMRMFTPFSSESAREAAEAKRADAGEIEALKRQVDEMRRRLDKLSGSG